jgi:hypothetical protein
VSGRLIPEVIAMASRHRRLRRASSLRRRLGLEANALRRPADHVESSIIVTIVLVFVIVAPLLGLLIGRSSYQSGVRAERAQAARHPATARLTVNAAKPAPAFDDATPPTVPAAARWTDAGVRHTGKVQVQPGTKAGTEVRVWVDHAGRQVAGQRTHLETVGHTITVGGASVFGLAFAFWLTGLFVRRVFIRRQLAAWDADWSAAEPRWTGRTGS